MNKTEQDYFEQGYQDYFNGLGINENSLESCRDGKLIDAYERGWKQAASMDLYYKDKN